VGNIPRAAGCHPPAHNTKTRPDTDTPRSRRCWVRTESGLEALEALAATVRAQVLHT